jgi:hypothetical protein
MPPPEDEGQSSAVLSAWGNAPGQRPQNGQGLKARPIRTNDEPGLQPSGELGDREPGALPQANIECAFGASDAGANATSVRRARGSGRRAMGEATTSPTGGRRRGPPLVDRAGIQGGLPA